jgi:hypothetical protein
MGYGRFKQKIFSRFPQPATVVNASPVAAFMNFVGAVAELSEIGGFISEMIVEVSFLRKKMSSNLEFP